MFVVICGHMFEGEDLQGIAECLLRWQPPLVPWLIELQEEVRRRAEEYGSEGAAFYNIIKSNPIIARFAIIWEILSSFSKSTLFSHLTFYIYYIRFHAFCQRKYI